MNAALELLLPQTHLVVRGSIPQRVFNWERANMNLNTALELLLPQTHFVIRGSILQRVSNWERFNMNLNTALLSTPQGKFRLNAALEQLLPQTHFVIRGSIHQHVQIGNVPINMRWSYSSDTFVFRSIHQR